MGRLLLIRIALVAEMLAVLATAGCRERNMKSKTDVAAVEKDVRDHLPIGSSRAEVAAYLDQRKIEHSYVGKLKALPKYEYNHTETAMIRDVSDKGLYRSDIQILFRFDDNDSKLLEYSVREIWKGP